MKIFIFVLAATIFESAGDAVLRVALRDAAGPARVGLFLLGAAMVTIYGTLLNLAPVDFASVTGLYIAILFIVFQITNYAFFRVAPTIGVIVGGTLIVAGGIMVLTWK